MLNLNLSLKFYISHHFPWKGSQLNALQATNLLVRYNVASFFFNHSLHNMTVPWKTIHWEILGSHSEQHQNYSFMRCDFRYPEHGGSRFHLQLTFLYQTTHCQTTILNSNGNSHFWKSGHILTISQPWLVWTQVNMWLGSNQKRLCLVFWLSEKNCWPTLLLLAVI